MKQRQISSFLWHLLIILWAVALALLILALVGMSHILSNLFGQTYLSLIVEIGFFALSGVFALLLWRFFPFPKNILSWVLAYFPPIAIFIIVNAC